MASAVGTYNRLKETNSTRPYQIQDSTLKASMVSCERRRNRGGRMSQCGEVDGGSLVLWSLCNGIRGRINDGIGALGGYSGIGAVEWSLSDG
jgi:hypothetical protein